MCVNFAPLLKVTVASVHFHFRKVRFFCPQLFVWTVTRKAALDIIYSDPYVESKTFRSCGRRQVPKGSFITQIAYRSWLVVEPTHPKNISQIGNLPQIGMQNSKNIWNHHQKKWRSTNPFHPLIQSVPSGWSFPFLPEMFRVTKIHDSYMLPIERLTRWGLANFTWTPAQKNMYVCTSSKSNNPSSKKKKATMQLNHACLYNTKRICFSTFPFPMWEFVSIQVLFFQRQRPLTIDHSCDLQVCYSQKFRERSNAHLISLVILLKFSTVKGLSQYSHGFMHPRWLCRISEPSTASRTSGSVSWPPYTRSLSEIEAQTLDLEELFGQPKRQRGPA